MSEVKRTNIQYIQYRPTFKAHENVFDYNKNCSLPNHLDDLLSNIEKTKNYKEFWTVIEKYQNKRPGVIKVGPNMLKDGEYLIKTGIEADTEYDKTILKALADKGIKMAPQFVKSANTKEGFSVSVLRIDGAKSGELLDYNKSYRLLSDDAKKAAYNELKNLTKLGIVNLDIINKNGLKITPDNPNRIVCDNWTNLCPVESYYCENSKTGARMNVMNKIYKILFQNNNENI